MVNNYTNINKTKEILNSDGQQLHQYKQNEQSPSSQIIEHKKDHVNWRWNPAPVLLQANTCGCVKPVNGIPSL